MKLNLTKPVIFFDLEATGVNILSDRIVEISMIKVFPDGRDVQETIRINPECHIPEESSAIHHIYDEDVANAPTFKDVAHKIAQNFEGCDIAGFCSNKFDVPMLSEEFARAGVDFDFRRPRYIDVQTIFHKKEQRNLKAAYRFYCDKELEDAHSANADTRATYEVLMAQLDRYSDLPNNVDQLAEFSSQNRNVDIIGRLIYDDQNREVINFGKYKGKIAEDVLRNDPGYYSWIMQGDFPSDTKRIVTAIKLRLRK